MPSVTGKERFLLFAILIFAFALRLSAIRFGLPHLYHADEPIVVNHALAYGTGDLNPHFFKIPPLISYLLFAAYGLYYILGKMAGFFPNIEAFERLFYSDPSSFYLLARVLFGAFLGTLTVYLFYRIVRRNFGREKALMNAFFLAVCFLHVRDSHYVYADIPLVLVLVAAFGIFLKIMDEPDKRSFHFASGALIGLAAAVKYNGIALVIPYVFAFVIAADKKKLLGFWFAAFLGVVITYFVLNPYSFLDFNFFAQEIRQQSKSHVGGVGWLYHLNYSLSGALGWPLLLAAGAGLLAFILSWIRDLKDRVLLKKSVLVVFILAYYLILVFESQPYERYVLPLLPFVLFFAADFVVNTAQKFKIQKAILVLAVISLALPTLIQSILFDRLMLAQDTRTLAKEWIEQNIPSASRLALDLEFYMPRLKFSQSQLEQKKQEMASEGHFSKTQMRKLDFLLSGQAATPTYDLSFLVNEEEAGDRKFLFSTPTLLFSYEALQKQGIQYVVVVKLWEKDLNQKFYDDLQSRATLVAEFNPYRNASRDWPYTHPLTGGPFLFKDIQERERNGQPIKIYKL